MAAHLHNKNNVLICNKISLLLSAFLEEKWLQLSILACSDTSLVYQSSYNTIKGYKEKQRFPAILFCSFLCFLTFSLWGPWHLLLRQWTWIILVTWGTNGSRTGQTRGCYICTHISHVNTEAKNRLCTTHVLHLALPCHAKNRHLVNRTPSKAPLTVTKHHLVALYTN